MKVKVKSNLGEIIESRGLKLKWVADQIKATPSQVTNWCKNEKGYANSTPNVLYLLRLQKLLNIRIDEIYEEIEWNEE